MTKRERKVVDRLVTMMVRTWRTAFPDEPIRVGDFPFFHDWLIGWMDRIHREMPPFEIEETMFQEVRQTVNSRMVQ